MSFEYNIPQGFKTIPRAAKRYVVTPTGTVFNMKTQKFLRQHFNGYSSYTTIKDPEGKQFRFNFDKPEFSYKPLTKEWVLDVERQRLYVIIPITLFRIMVRFTELFHGEQGRERGKYTCLRNTPRKASHTSI